ncbi:hypothetical protein GW17_00062432 [Ensete ventricosum]|nr:hypothetical protein GW17_00062432 [Ensete ventricosum]
MLQRIEDWMKIQLAVRKEGGRSRPGPLQGWLATATAWPSARGRSAMAKAPCRGSRLQRGARKSDDLQRSSHPQRQPPVGTAPVGGPEDRWPREAAPQARRGYRPRAAAPGRGQRRPQDEGRRGELWHPFEKRMIIPLKI